MKSNTTKKLNTLTFKELSQVAGANGECICHCDTSMRHNLTGATNSSFDYEHRDTVTNEDACKLICAAFGYKFKECQEPHNLPTYYNLKPIHPSFILFNNK